MEILRESVVGGNKVRLNESLNWYLKVHKRENFLGFDFEICTFS